VTEDRRNDGIATEAMEAAIDDLFSRTDVETITAYISDGGNEASRRVAAKLGFSVRGRGHGRSGEPMTVYTLPRDDWLRQRPEASARSEDFSPGPASCRQSMSTG
jgi:RimJ/RimL family protein N-acetyltransferase